MLSAARPWTYWMALPLLLSSMRVLASVEAVYLKKVVELNLRRLNELAAARTMASNRAGRRQHPLGPG